MLLCSSAGLAPRNRAALSGMVSAEKTGVDSKTRCSAFLCFRPLFIYIFLNPPPHGVDTLLGHATRRLANPRESSRVLARPHEASANRRQEITRSAEESATARRTPLRRMGTSHDMSRHLTKPRDNSGHLVTTPNALQELCEL